MGFIDTLRAEGYAVESICRVLCEQGCPIAARTYRAWRAARQPAARTVSDATLINAIVDARYTTDPSVMSPPPPGLG
jgi:putative transposase